MPVGGWEVPEVPAMDLDDHDDDHDDPLESIESMLRGISRIDPSDEQVWATEFNLVWSRKYTREFTIARHCIHILRVSMESLF